MTNPLETPADVAAELHRLADIVATFTQGHDPGPPERRRGLGPCRRRSRRRDRRVGRDGRDRRIRSGRRLSRARSGCQRARGSPRSRFAHAARSPTRRITEADRPLLATIAATNTDGAFRVECDRRALRSTASPDDDDRHA